MEFGSKLKALRTGKGLTQQQLADRLQVAKSIVSYYESGDRFPSYDVLVRIAHTFHVTTDYLLDVERKRVLDVSELSERNIAIIESLIEALEEK